MKTVKYLAEKNCKVKIKGVYYTGDKVLPTDMSDEEIKRLLAARFIRKLILDEGEETKDSKQKKDGDKKSAAREALLKEAKEFGLAFTQEVTDEDIQKAIAEAKAKAQETEKPLDKMTKDELKAKAKELQIDVGMLDSEEKIRQKIKEAQGAGA